MLDVFPRADLAMLARQDEPVRTLALLAALRFVSGDDLVAHGAQKDDLAGFEADDAVLRLPLQRTVTMARPVDVYALRHGGAMALSQALGRDVSSIAYETRSSCRRSVSFMDHSMAVSRFALQLVHGLRDASPARLVSWTMDPREVRTGVDLTGDATSAHAALIPDALARIDGPRGTECLVIEIDRWTERPSYMAAKYAAYRAWWMTGEHVRAFGARAVRIVTIAPEARRKRRLMEACREAIGGKAGGLFWFAADDELTRHGALSPVWSTQSKVNLELWEKDSKVS